jgi:Na+-transporting NADH:ubiquinone oxidoreductase subunit NqrB
MKELDLATFVAVFQEMLGWTLWAFLGAATLGMLAFLYVLLRDHGVVARRLVWAEAFGVLGGVAAVLMMFVVTNSDPRDLGGPVDWLLVVGIFTVGLIATTVGSYAGLGLLAGAPPSAAPATRHSPVQA